MCWIARVRRRRGSAKSQNDVYNDGVESERPRKLTVRVERKRFRDGKVATVRASKIKRGKLKKTSKKLGGSCCVPRALLAREEIGWRHCQ